MSRIFGILRPGWQKVWQAFAQEVGGSFSRERGKRIKTTPTIRTSYKSWYIKIDAPKKGRKPTMTRVRAAYHNTDSFFFRIYREGLFQGLRKKFGLQDIEIGFAAFDEAFIIQGNDPKKLQALFQDEEIRKIISWQPDIHLKNIVDEDWKLHEEQKGLSVLEFKIMGLISNIERLHDLHELFKRLLDRLVEIGSALDEAPIA
ncbi:MAG: DUF3137 domain-containing protein [Bacteroidota bacterium]